MPAKKHKQSDNAYHCKRCGYSWNAKKGMPVACRNCESPYWQNVITKDKPSGEFYIHFRRRLLERYGLRINKDQYHALNRSILENKEKLVNPRYNGTLEVYTVTINKTTVVVGFDRQYNNAVTVLPYYCNYQATNTVE
jgi:DNA-directed RNA polymerase subunit RPC12/RpoP